ncbi:hypothetical protein MMC32_002001 [Xylographa parallela]|nr:hypothetical protein [Xylographa parallela]
MATIPCLNRLPKLYIFILGVLYSFGVLGHSIAEISGIDNSLESESFKHDYKPRILHIDPLFVHLHNFLTPSEISHFLNISSNSFARSQVTGSEANGSISAWRTSETYFVDYEDPMAHRVADRVFQFLDFLDPDGLEPLQVVRYKSAQAFRTHFDWFNEPVKDTQGRYYNRLATIFVYLDGNCTGGETYFPGVKLQPSMIDGKTINDPFNRSALGVVPEAGNAVFWVNEHSDGTGHRKTAHSGLPVKDGTKVGLNIWLKRFTKLPYTPPEHRVCPSLPLAASCSAGALSDLVRLVNKAPCSALSQMNGHQRIASSM